MTKNLKCFIACAFGQKDVDSIYSKNILPVLKEYKIIPLRVDKINHNKNIDQKIVELIKSADFCISDLTYARPSVYYEAGYIHGQKKEVIFTVRKDHFQPNIEDINGNLKIHFDLITKNIIDWTQPNNKFKNRLKSRIKLIIAPINESLKTDAKLLKAEKKWLSQSLIEKFKTMKVLSENLIIEHKYKIIKEKNRGSFGIRKHGEKYDVISFLTYESLTLNELQRFNYPGFLDNVGSVTKAKRGKLTIIFNCFNKISTANIQKAFADYNLKEINNIIIANNSKKRIILIIVNKIKSDLDYLERVNEIIKKQY